VHVAQAYPMNDGPAHARVASGHARGNARGGEPLPYVESGMGLPQSPGLWG
jgi:hypothetical protein